jgi:formylglycine-generating enzyme required for sulfatase activity
MLHVPAAKFQRDNPDSIRDENRVETVAIAGYCLDQTEVTVKAYAACEAAKGCADAPRTVTDSSSEERERQSWFCNQEDQPDHPVNCVSWKEAEAYCKWAGKRLPTPEEWVYAAQGQDNRTYPWGNDPPSERRLNACGTECVAMAKRVLHASYSPLYKASDGWETTAPVGSFPGDASPFGILDMGGNVREWTDGNDGWNARVCGGSWRGIDRLNARGKGCDVNGAKYRSNINGFRCARNE